VHIRKHTESCKGWREAEGGQIFPFDKIKIVEDLYVDGQTINEDYQQRQICAQWGWDLRFKNIKPHLNTHGISADDYRAK
ncbi:hypothetical protein, partial [Streptococcus pneumoniae]|uniref:hypothetical protein n=1 Tax=Streptococcus pneumoniae TaxID=1313 RepID=UPI0018B04070